MKAAAWCIRATARRSLRVRQALARRTALRAFDRSWDWMLPSHRPRLPPRTTADEVREVAKWGREQRAARLARLAAR
jgi:hypothetical protein